MGSEREWSSIRLEAMIMSDDSCVLNLLVRASARALSCLILDQRLCPDSLGTAPENCLRQDDGHGSWMTRELHGAE